MKPVVVGTAGHIDHGKTALVKALTGIDADRLEEEKRRGITIDIGFAHLELTTQNGERLRLGFVDVPGHERFVRNMLAGIGGIDLVLLVIAADEGIKPQTREHFDICRLLGIQRGITVLTKSDAVDAETLEVVRLEVEDFLRGSFLDPGNAPIIAVSSLTGSGLEELRSAIAKVAGDATAKDSSAIARLPIDRVFTMKGFGTVVTGTLVAGTIPKEDELEIFPPGKRVRVRGVQVHGAPAERAVAGQRTALNLAGIANEEISRGMVLAPPETFRSMARVATRMSLLRSAKLVKDGTRVHFHAYTMETIAQVRLYGAKQLKPGEEGYAEFRLEQPTLLLPGDRFILRQFSPVVTIGGGIVLDAMPLPKMKNVTPFLEVLEKSSAEAVLEARVKRRGMKGLPLSQVIVETGWSRQVLARHLTPTVQNHTIRRFGDMLIAEADFAQLLSSITRSVVEFHKSNPLVAGIGRQELRERLQVDPAIFDAGLDAAVREKKLEVAGEVVRLPGHGIVMKDEEAESRQIIEHAFASAGLKVPFLHEVLAGLKVDRTRAQKIVTLMLRDKVLVKISDQLVFHQTALNDLRSKVAALKTSTSKIDVAHFKDLTGVSRKYAIPLLEYLDRERVTRRVGDERVIL